jgi:hypothetical protein
MAATIYAVGVAVSLTLFFAYFCAPRARTKWMRAIQAGMKDLRADCDEARGSLEEVRELVTQSQSAIAARVAAQDETLARAHVSIEEMQTRMAELAGVVESKYEAQQKKLVRELQTIEQVLRDFVVNAKTRQDATDERLEALAARQTLADFAGPALATGETSAFGTIRVPAPQPDTECETVVSDDEFGEAVLIRHTGERIAGARLARLIERALVARAALEKFPPMIPAYLLEQAAIAGVLNPLVLADRGRAEQAAAYVAHRLERAGEADERGWTGDVSADRALRFRREIAGVTETITLDRRLITGTGAHQLDTMAGELQGVYLEPSLLVRKGETVKVHGPRHLLQILFGRQAAGIDFREENLAATAGGQRQAAGAAAVCPLVPRPAPASQPARAFACA